ncbi:MAG: hypothetical protein A3A33_03965 [Candidatus Yanofskybacteria bacterium RIFCSPLOWO2_01_FULL_49_25]|uniref:HTH HARE-type domain-containing protein n=1 Tax=Candidatus Yanofskybacteria bacterium RIFCSPLOWO2_01_FULL_49_25 TaxID=1802701 RepID=A0A1F8GRM1_9BACT|nr:MAG: hypothetical protein A3A33_03965 [Candidatus Yanofskybacteria bacterium RIFCSPLOWO2_01_FULL_49_25]
MANEAGPTIKKLIGQLTASLNPRNKEIIFRRFGLKSGHKETLESIGQSHGITRERVRQIEEASLASVREHLAGEAGQKVKSFAMLAKSILEETNGVAREDVLFEKFSGSPKENPTNAGLVFVLTLDGTFKRHLDDDEFRTFWALSADHASAFKADVASFVSALEKNKKPVTGKTVADLARANASIKPMTSEMLATYLAVSKRIGKNVFGEIGLTSWPEIKPRGVRDKSYLVLRRETKPKHFREIAELINASGFSNRRAHVQTVHNELIKDPRFVLVGRGMYGLSEWGYEPGTVKEVIANLLKKEGPMHKDDIVARVLSTRLVKPNTILLGIQDKKLFSQNEKGHIALREA